LLPAISQDALYFSFGIPVGFSLTLVVQLLAPCDSDIDLGLAIVQSNPEWNQRLALLLQIRPNLSNLGFVHEELARPIRVVVGVTSMDVGLDSRAQEPKLSILNPGIGFGNRDLAIPDRLDFGTLQDHTCFNGLIDKIFVVRTPVRRDHAVRPSRFFCNGVRVRSHYLTIERAQF